MRRVLIAVALLIAMAANVAMQPWYNTLFMGPQRDTTALGVLLEALGEVRTFLAQTIWFETDLYHHQLEAEGVVWTQERDLMSMYRMITTLDPRFVEAYDIGAYQLVQNFHKVDEGLAYLDEGVRNNPDSAQLRFEKAFLLYFLKRYREAAAEAGLAMALYAPDPAALLQMEPSSQIAFLNAMRIFAHAEKELGDRDLEAHALRIWLLLRPQDPYAIGRMKALGLPPHGYTPEQFLQAMGGR